jgi:hypothetical protein
MKKLKISDFQEKEVKNTSMTNVTGGANPEVGVTFTIDWRGFFNGNSNLFDGIKGNTTIDELDEGKVSVS